MDTEGFGVFAIESLIGKVTETIHACNHDFLSEVSLYSVPNVSYMYFSHSSCKNLISLRQDAV